MSQRAEETINVLLDQAARMARMAETAKTGEAAAVCGQSSEALARGAAALITAMGPAECPTCKAIRDLAEIAQTRPLNNEPSPLGTDAADRIAREAEQDGRDPSDIGPEVLAAMMRGETMGKQP